MTSKPTQSKLGSVLTAFVYAKRTELGIVQSHMARELDMNQSCYSKLEKGYRDFTLFEIEAIAAIFDMSLPEFFLKGFTGDGNVLNVLQNSLNLNKTKTAERLRRELVATGERFASTQMLLEIMLYSNNTGLAI
jgi:transcriptional regulator with XRE-family HTH domain